MGLRPSAGKAIRAILWALLLVLAVGVVLQLVALDDPELVPPETGLPVEGREEAEWKKNEEDGRSAVQTAHAVLAPTTRVEVWGKAAVGDYFWEHIFRESREPRDGGLWFEGKGMCGSAIELNFRSGYSVNENTVPRGAQNVVVILNAHNKDKIPWAESWMKLLYKMPQLKRVGLIVLGEESCNNLWLVPHLKKLGERLAFVFLVYGGPLTDQYPHVQSWPLGVATYRNFPAQLPLAHELIAQPRRHLCNFMGTVYQHSSRERLMTSLDSLAPYLRQKCHVAPRYKWMSKETTETAEQYKQTLLQSDLTLAPAGLNTECYRWYEAVVAGSVPVIEDVVKPVTCGRGSLVLLKDEGAPFLYIKSWAELPALLEAEAALPLAYKVNRRRNLLLWYEAFKDRMRQRFCDVAASAFLPQSR